MEIFQYKHSPVPVTRVVLPNGLTLFVAEKQSKTVLAQLNIAAGSLDDGDLPGTAHFLEHMILGGSSYDGIHPKLRRLYTKGIDANASTGLISTEYCIDGFQEDFADVILSIFSIVFDASFEKPQIIKEREVILQEIRESDHEDELDLQFRKILYPDIPAVRHSSCGYSESVKKIQRKNLEEYYKRWYRPENASLIIIGSIPFDKVAEFVLKISDSAKREAENKSRILCIPRFVREEIRTDKTHPVLTLYFEEPDDYEMSACLILTDRLLNSPSLGLLYEKLRLNKRIIYGISGNNSDWPLSYSMIQARALPKHFAYIEKEIFKGINRLIKCDYSSELFETVKSDYRMSFVRGLENMTMEKLASHMTSLWIEGKLDKDIDEEKTYLNMTREKISIAVKKYLRRDQYGSISLLPK